LFIVFEGIDGSGKSTQARLLADKLRLRGMTVVLTSEPSAGAIGKKIRSLVKRLAPVEELELFTEDRKDHVKRLIRPALQAGHIVLSDRYYYSSAAYQGTAGLNPHEIIRTNRAFAPQPDITFFLDISPAAALERIAGKRREGLSPFETLENLKKVGEVYSLIQDSSFVIIDAAREPSIVHASIWGEVEKHLGKEVKQVTDETRRDSHHPAYQGFPCASNDSQ